MQKRFDERTLAELLTAERRSRIMPPKTERPLCGARCRSKAGAPCVARVVAVRGHDGRVAVRNRCRMHGGLSTGARTKEGRSRLAEAGRRGAAERWRKWREAHAEERSAAA